MDFVSELNDEQKKVVLHKDGPMLVIAGAGTGKTKTITNRILHLMQNENAPAGSILALTFTEKATHEMKDRVEMHLPLSHEELNIKTFHSFCDNILRERAYEIGLSPSYKLLDGMHQWLFMKKNLFRFDLNYYRPLGNPSRFIWSLLQHFQRLKDENITPEKYIAYAEAFEANDDVLKEEKEKLLELSNAFKQYQNFLINENAMDFGDLTYYVLKLFNNRKSVLAEYQDQFKFILVDEFQDTNFAQSQLIFMLADKHKNIVVVGDDDQSIYKWRGASLSNIIHFEKEYFEAKRIVLKENYRSTQNILNSSYALIQNNNPDRLEVREKVDKRLNSQFGDGARVQVVHLENSDSEVAFAIEKINELIKSKDVSYRDFAILLRTNALSEQYIKAFKELSIPYQIKNPRGFFRTEIVRDILGLFRVLQDRDDDVAFFRLLSMPILELSQELLQDYLAKAKKQSMSLFDVLEVEMNAGESLPGFEGKSITLLKLIKNLKGMAYKSSIGKTIYHFLEELGVVEFLQNSDDSESIRSFEHLSTFSRIVSQFDLENPDPSPGEFLEYISLLEEADMSFELDSDDNEDSVQILTVHSSKGLEFKYVFVGSLVAQRFPGKNMKDPFDIPADLINEVLPEKDHHLEEERRLMYTAMTRAKEQLFLTFSDYYDGKRKWKPSLFLGELEGLDSIEWLEYPNVKRTFSTSAISDEKPLLSKASRPHRSLSRFSYSQFDAYKTCPLKYKFRYVYKLAPPPSHASQFGSSIHNTLNDFYQRMRRGEDHSFEVLKELYEEHWLPYGYTSKTHQLARKKSGLNMLESFYEVNSKPNWVIPAFLEKPFSLKFGPAQISGRIDRIDKLSDGTYEVIDYKTGKSKVGANLKKDLQLGLYAIACQEIFKIKVSKLTLYFLDDNATDSINIEDLKIGEIKDAINELCTEIPGSSFDATPGFACGFCDYRLVCQATASKVA